jgi:hypothetical protein
MQFSRGSNFEKPLGSKSPVTGRGSPMEDVENPHSVDIRLTDGDEIVSLTHRPRPTLKKNYFSASDIHFF